MSMVSDTSSDLGGVYTNEEKLQLLVDDFLSGDKVLFITGAGLSVASGIQPYRKTSDAVWENFLVDCGTRAKFKKNPSWWYNRFWLQTHEKIEYYEARPNAGHIAIANISKTALSTRVVTQNIDRLHLKTCLDPDRLIEVHGRLGLYKCLTRNCKYRFSESIENINIHDLACSGSFEEGTLEIEVPKCPACGASVLPQALLFDENYTSHSFYQWRRALEWMEEADVIVFVGTSFSVGVTSEAMYFAKEDEKRVYSFNLCEEAADEENFFNIIGRAEDTLPELYRQLRGKKKKRMYIPSKKPCL